MLTSFGQFFVIFDSTVLNVGFASIEKDFSNVARTTLAWALTSYSIGTASLLLLAGRVADLFGRKRVFLVGISIFAIGSLGAGLAPNVGILIATRAVQSVGGALMVPTSIALALLTLGVLEGEKWGWTSPGILASFVGVVLFGWIVIRRSLTHAEPLLDMSIFRHRRFSTASIATFTLNLPVAGFWFSAPLFFQTVWDWSVLKSGFAIMPTPVIIFLTATIAGRFSDGALIKPIIATGAVCCATGIIGLALFLDAEANYWMHYLPFAAIYGIGLGLSWSNLTAAALVGIDHEKFGVANGTNLTFRQVGGAMGVAMSIAVAGESRVLGSAAAFHRVWLVLSIWMIATVIFFTLAYPKISAAPGDPHN
ncbi:MAG: MFS transporter [Acidobacteria bacterium]|nr:MFS transporter [Acidobacteriota bacterium]